MAITINEQFNKRDLVGSTQWYDIRVNIESDNLDDIEQVEYYMDRSISTPVIISANPDTKFSAKVTFKDHRVSPLTIQTQLKHAS